MQLAWGEGGRTSPFSEKDALASPKPHAVSLPKTESGMTKHCPWAPNDGWLSAVEFTVVCLKMRVWGLEGLGPH